VTNTISASLITFFVYGGATGINGTSFFTAAMIAATKEILFSVLSTSMLENLIDKGIVFAIVYSLMSKIPRRFLSQYSVSIRKRPAET
ncbi:MAG TPA: ECF transporter S component, partial [Clostridiales bacterium]|nr:ECF transporter S component [Clostridiales bacterium]